VYDPFLSGLKPAPKVWAGLKFWALPCLLAFFTACPDRKAPPVAATTAYPYFDTPALELEQNEESALQMQTWLRAALLGPIRDRQWSKLESVFSRKFSANWPEPSDWKVINDPSFTSKRSQAPKHIVSAKDFQKALRALLDPWASIERADWRTFDSRVSQSEPKQIAQRVHFRVAGQIDNESKGEFRATISLLAEKHQSSWKLKQIRFDKLSISRSRLPPFRDISAAAGFDHFLSVGDQDNLQSMIDVREMTATGGLTALDFNHDGFWDVLASHQAKGTTLFLNDGQGGFRKKKLDILSKTKQAAKFYLWLDFDGDGQEELLSTRPKIYKIKKGVLIEQKNALKFDLGPAIIAPNFEGLTACDVNGDQKLDIIAAGYSHANSPQGFNNIDSHAGVRNLVFINQGQLKFRDESLARGITGTRYSFVVECFDFDRDGDLDLYFGNDYGPNEYYENDGSGQFKLQPKHPLAEGTSYSMGISIADYDNSGDISLSISNMYSHSGSRIVPFSKGLSPKMKETLSKLAAGNTLYSLSDGHFTEHAKKTGVDLADWAWGNIFFDFDNDGDKDLYVVNGYTTHRDQKAPDF
jgi:hypothetical protein